MAHHRERHPEFTEGCLPCKLLTVSVSSNDPDIRFLRQRETDLHRYREKRKAGEQPDGTTRKAMERSEKKQVAWERSEKKLIDSNPPEVVSQLRKSALNR